MSQSSMFDGLSIDPFSLFDDGFGPAEVGIGGRNVAQALMVALVVVVLDERLDLGLEVAGRHRPDRWLDRWRCWRRLRLGVSTQGAQEVDGQDRLEQQVRRCTDNGR